MQSLDLSPVGLFLGASLVGQAVMAVLILASLWCWVLIIEGVIALKEGDAIRAVRVLQEANGVLDTWLGHFDLGRAYLKAAGGSVQADSEFESLIKRRGEALAVLMDEEPTYGYFPQVYYYQGQVREQMKNAGSADSYRAYLGIRDKSTEDPLLPDIRKRAGN